ncbi:hypothetical protein Salat_1689500 [Sesamum alatum]|uniref:Uncharacterized protein n=1 Tax=Sesamum alatum TaxID=300844 RepID=A0AAE1Y771_9LAMI|nr:hypothetical protein Salat_1689500 [Sesamum alatum]
MGMTTNLPGSQMNGASTSKRGRTWKILSQMKAQEDQLQDLAPRGPNFSLADMVKAELRKLMMKEVSMAQTHQMNTLFDTARTNCVRLEEIEETAGSWWRISFGVHVRVSLDRCIPRASTFRFITLVQQEWRFASDVSFIDHDVRQWKEDLVGFIFRQDDAEQILNIQLPQFRSLDERIWHYTKSGIYYVKSGYHIAFASLETRPGSSLGM